MKYLFIIPVCIAVVGCATPSNTYERAFQSEARRYAFYETTPEILFEIDYVQQMALLGVVDNLEKGYLEGGEQEFLRRVEAKRDFIERSLALVKADMKARREVLGERGKLFRYQRFNDRTYEYGLIVLGEDGREIHRWITDTGPLLDEEQ